MKFRYSGQDYFSSKGQQERIETIRKVHMMRKEYDFSKSVRNPYEKHLKKRVTLRLGTDVIEYFKDLADETGIPYQSLINLYLQDCVQTKKKLKWASYLKDGLLQR